MQYWVLNLVLSISCKVHKREFSEAYLICIIIVYCINMHIIDQYLITNEFMDVMQVYDQHES